MSGAQTTHIAARLLSPDMLERGRVNALSCPLWRSGSLVAPASGTVSIFDRSGAALVDGAAVVVVSSVATYSYTPAASLQLDEGWRVEWSLVVDGAARVFRNDAALVRVRLAPVVADADLFARHSSLDPAGRNPISTVTTWQTQRDEAWAEIQLRLISRGNRPNLIMSPSALRLAHLFKSLELVFDDLATRLNEAYADTARDYRGRFEAEWGRLTFSYDEDDSGEADSDARRSAIPSVWLL